MSDRTAWVSARLGVRVSGRPGGLDIADLAGLAVRRNPRRAHLVVSTVLGKHIPVDPRLAYAAARLLGERAAAFLGDTAGGTAGDAAGGTAGGTVGGGATAVVRSALHGDGEALAKCCGPDDPGVAVPVPPLVLGYAETATGLGHAVADSFTGARYLHSTRRAVAGMSATGTFEESHSHATEHLLLPADPAWLRDDAPVVLVDDELTTGRTAVATIEALHRLAPRDRYVVASLLDLRTDEDRARFAAAASRLGARIDVAALATGSVHLPPDVLPAGEALVAEVEGAAAAARLDDARTTRVPAPEPGVDRAPSKQEGTGAVRRVDAAWPVGLPEGGRHGFGAGHRPALAAAVDALAAEVAAGLPPGRVLVLGTEELMYTPLRLALALTEHRDDVGYSTTTRSPVLPVDDPGYAIRTRLTFTSPEPDPTGAPRFAYNVAGQGSGPIVVVVDTAADTPALWGPGGLVEALRAECGSLTVAVVPAVTA